jgi:CheY-like chemotaxis protein
MSNILAQMSLVSAHVPTQSMILIVDDDPVFRNVTRGFLAALGYRVDEAENGLDGLRCLKSEVPDLIICDLSMPVLDGLEFVEEVTLEYPAIPLIVISATEQISDVAKALKFGIKDFLAKPIANFKELQLAVESALDESNAYVADGRDFASQWWGINSATELNEEQELHWHLEYLRNNPNEARELLQALMPENESSQGIWQFSYRLLQSAEMMPLVFDYAWLINGQFAFYLVDSNSQQDGVATTLLVRALFHDYLRNLRHGNADLKDLAEILEKGIECSDSAGPISAVLGVADLAGGTLAIQPAGIDVRWSSGTYAQQISAGVVLGNNCLKNFITDQLPLSQRSQLSLSSLGSSSFVLEINKMPY